MNQDMHPQSAPEAVNAVETAPEPAPQPALQYTGIDSVFAWVCFVFGYLFCRAFPPLDDPMGAFLFVLVLFVATYVVLKLKKAVVAPSALFTAIAAVGISASMLLTENRWLVSLSYLCAMAGYLYFVYAATGNCLQGGFSDLVVADYFKALF
ncbi:MAG: hypothetical protein IJW89_04530, partial [Clostridia bacterium]|nr:hypothetical protein [Clostridia bacterium]